MQYDLIRVTEAVEGRYWYERYTGLEIGQGEARLREGERVEEGNFYLRERDSGAVLKLYPLTLSWLSEESLTEAEGASVEAALYKWLSGDRVIYLLPAMLVDRQTEEVVDEIVKLQVLVQRAREEWAEAPALTWELLVEGLEGVTEDQVGEGEGKYDRELYLVREDVKQAFEEFLWGEKRGFVLTGKSGVGKSNFLLALRDEHRERGTDVCMVVYNGSNLHVEEALLERVGQDLGRVLRVRRLDRVLARIEEIEGIEKRRVVLAVDAVNEHAEPTAVMERVNEVVKTARMPWLKVVVTSRPEAWRTIRRRLGEKLVDGHYYRRRGEYRLGIELEGFTYQESWIKMDPFERGELPQVYEKYQAVYGLKTAYGELTERMRQVMRDPLMLRLVARIYKEEQVPADVRVGEIYENYVDMLVESGRLEVGDVRFLERELVPLMVKRGRYGNAVMAEQVERAKTADGIELFELIHNAGIGRSGQRVNQAFQNLADAEILALRGGARDYHIEFAYERFYEFFVGKRLKELVGEDEGRRVEEYIRLVGETETRPYLWGAVRTAILQEEGKERLLWELVEEEDDRVKEMVVDCLVEMGKETMRGRGERRAGYEKTVRMVRELMRVRAVDERGGILRQGLGKVVRVARRLLGVKYVDALHARHLRDIALEVVYGLADSAVEREELYEILIDAFGEPLWEIRRKATRYLYSLWRLHPAERECIFEALGSRLGLTTVVSSSAFLQAAIEFSLRILFSHYEDRQTMEQLLSLASGILDRLPQFVLEAGSSLAVSMLTTLLPGSQLTGIEKLLKDEPLKKDLLHLARYMDLARTLGPEEFALIEKYIRVPAKRIDPGVLYIRQYFAKNTLQMQATRHFHQLRGFIEELFDDAAFSTQGWLIATPTFTHPSTYPYAPPDEVYALVDKLTREHLRRYHEEWYLEDYRPFIFVSRLWCTQSDEAIPIFCDLFAQALDAGDWPRLRREIFELAYVGHLYPLQALRTLDTLDDWERTGIHDILIDTLAAIRFVAPDLCETYLEKRMVSPSFLDAVRRSRGNPSMLAQADILDLNQFGLDAVVGSEALRDWVINMLDEASECKTVRQLARFAIRKVFDLVREQQLALETVS